ncbi:MAG TPA: ATP-binding protein [Gaiellaceae bacterium]|nr:ATP-binding protein [Gaiellaceae bacterium]
MDRRRDEMPRKSSAIRSRSHAGPELEREQQLVEALQGISRAVTQKRDLLEVIQLVTDEATRLTGAQFGAFFYNVVRRDGESYSLYTISGVPRSAFEKFPLPRPTEIFRLTFEGTETVRLHDVTQDPRYGLNAPHHGMPPGHLPVKSYLAVPVFASDGSVLGGLFFGHELEGRFDEQHERIASAIATQSGVAIEWARLLAGERAARAEAEARADAAFALDAVEDGVIMLDSEGFVRLWNRAAVAITGLSPETVLGRPIGEALPGWERIALDVPVSERKEAVTPATLPLDTLEGREVWLSVYGVAFGDGVVFAFRDVTGQRQLESLRADVVATVSHELRTPVAAVYGAAQTLRHRKLSGELTDQLLGVIDDESSRLAHLVEEILLTSQLDSGFVRFAPREVDPLEIVKASIRSAVGANGESIPIERPESRPRLRADADRVRQILTNLIENALKYGSQNGSPARVLIRVRDLGRSVRIEVVDNGPGIPIEDEKRIFEKFFRLDPALARGVGGTGLGLYIARELTRRMDGRIGVKATPGGGATFWVELPASWPAAP